MPEMNMIFQCCFVMRESSIRERMSVSLGGASVMGAPGLHASPPREGFSSRTMKLSCHSGCGKHLCAGTGVALGGRARAGGLGSVRNGSGEVVAGGGFETRRQRRRTIDLRRLEETAAKLQHFRPP